MNVIPTGFAAATAVSQAAGRPGTYRGEIAPQWDIVGNANGGYLMALAMRAVLRETGRDDPVSVSAHYTSPGQPGPVEVDVDVLKSGRTFATANARLRSAEGRTLLAILATTGSLAPSTGAPAPERIDAVPPALPDPDDCIRLEPTETFPPPIMGQVDLRIHPEDAGFAVGEKSGIPRVRGWFRLPNDERVDTLSLLFATDAFPPTIFNADLPVAWTPTIELTAHVRARPAPGWLRCVFTTKFITGGFLEADGEIWDSTGILVAQSRQLALVPRG